DIVGGDNRRRADRGAGEYVAVADLRVQDTDDGRQFGQRVLLADALPGRGHVHRRGRCVALHLTYGLVQRLQRGVGRVDGRVDVGDGGAERGDVGQLRARGDGEALVDAHAGINRRLHAAGELRREIRQLLVDVLHGLTEQGRTVIDAADRHFLTPY